LDEAKILHRLRAALSDGSRNNRFIAWVWQDAGTFRIKRENPYATPPRQDTSTTNCSLAGGKLMN
jgi:hypothetical protein